MTGDEAPIQDARTQARRRDGLRPWRELSGRVRNDAARGRRRSDPACYRVADDDRKGELRAVSDATACRTNEAPLAWNIQGQKGDTGDVGPVGPQGPPGASSTRVFVKRPPGVFDVPHVGTTLATLDVPAGTYFAFAKLRFFNQASSSAIGQCNLAFRGSADGNWLPGGDHVVLTLEPYGQAAGEMAVLMVAATIPAGGGQELLACNNNDLGGDLTADDVVLMAIEATALTQE